MSENVREKNLSTIRKFLECSGPERKYTRAPLFSDDARKEMVLNIDGKEIYQDTTAKEWLEQSVEMFPDWGFYDNIIFQCDDPNLFLVRSNGRGFKIDEDKKIPVSSFYINEFIMENGLIKRFRETYEPCAKIHDKKIVR